MKKNKALAVPFVLWAILFIAVPLVMVVWYGVTVEETPAYVEVEGIDGQTMFQLEDGTLTAERPETQTVVSLANFKRMLEPTYLKLLLRSLKIALFTTILCLLLGYPVALILSGRDFKRPGLWLMLIILPMWMNFLLRTMAWQTLLEKNGVINSILSFVHLPALEIINTPWAIILGMVYNFLPFMVLPIYNVLIKIDRDVINAARDLGASSSYTFLKIILPLSIPGIISGITMVFVPALTTFVISDLLGGGKILLIGNVIEQSFKQNSNWHVGSGLSMVLMVFIIASMALVAKYDKEGEGSSF